MVAYRSIESLSTLLQGKSKAKGTDEHENHRTFKQNIRSATCRRERRETQGENSSGACMSTNTTSETTEDHK
jgi:hypothetical protein